MQPFAPTPPLPENLLSDAAVSTQDEDEFQRFPFAQRIAATIYKRLDSASLVLGLYGKWGSGKTSVLKFIEGELVGTDVVTMVFNPWLFSGEEQLLLGFFAEFGEKLRPLGLIGAEAATTAMAAFSKKIVERMRPFRQDAPTQVQAFESTASLEGIKQQLHETLRGSGKRMLVLIDDVDRLDKQEVQAILRLVKLTADFPYTTYLLAFDETIVARALSERYPGGGKAAGKRFLEKIIQVPLRLPVIQREAMLKYFTKRLQLTLQLTDIQLTEPELNRLTKTLSDSVLQQLITPRDVNRYANTLSVVMPLLQGEANMVDLMLVEALKTFFPAVYKLIATNQHVVTGGIQEIGLDEARTRRESTLGIKASKLGEARELVFRLFPLLQKLYVENQAYWFNEAYRTEEDIYQEKSIASSYYFKRYFSYAVQDGEIPDKSFVDFTQAISQGDMNLAYQLAVAMIERANEEEFLRLLKHSHESVASTHAAAYCNLLVRLSDKFSPEVTGNFYMSLFTRVPGLFLLYMLSAPEPQRISLTQHALQHATPTLSYYLMNSINDVTEWEDSQSMVGLKAFFTPERYQQVANVFISRILQELAGHPLYHHYGAQSLNVFVIWRKALGTEPVNAYLQAILTRHPEELKSFLRVMSPNGFKGSESYHGHLNLSIYHDIAAIFDTNFLYQIALSLLADSPLEPYLPARFSSPTDEHRVHEFINLYNQVSAQDEATQVDGV